MSQIQYTKVKNSGEENVVVFIEGRPLLQAQSSHRNYSKIIEQLEAYTDTGYLPGHVDTFVTLFDEEQVVRNKFERLSERVTVKNGVVYFDGDELNSVIAERIIDFLDAGVDDWSPLCFFLEKLMQNPNENSREELYGWIERNELTLTTNGDFVAHKGVDPTDEDGVYQSRFEGTATVDGEIKVGRIPNYVGAVVEMPRSEVDEGSSHCSVGLHVSTHWFAKTYAGGAMLAVHVNPRDVAAVPGGAAKIRVCRYVVVEIIDAPVTGLVVPSPTTTWDEYEGEEDEGYCDGGADICVCPDPNNCTDY